MLPLLRYHLPYMSFEIQSHLWYIPLCVFLLQSALHLPCSGGVCIIRIDINDLLWKYLPNINVHVNTWGSYKSANSDRYRVDLPVCISDKLPSEPDTARPQITLLIENAHTCNPKQWLIMVSFCHYSTFHLCSSPFYN